MNRLLFPLLMFTSAIASAQQPNLNSDNAGTNSQSTGGVQATIPVNPIPNPFETPENGSQGMASMGEMGMMTGGGAEGSGGYEGMMMMGGEMGMDMGMGMGMGEMGMSAEDKFRRGLQRAILALGNAKSEPEKATLRQYVRQALENRYLKMIADRQQEVEKLKLSVAKLESDLKRRASAKDRVIEVQMQSVQLAAEGLLQLGDLSGNGPGIGLGMSGGMGSGYGGAEEYGMGGMDSP